MSSTPAPIWDPQRYLDFGGERGRAFVDLLARVPAVDPAAVVDLGCGPGNLTRGLAARWPTAQVLGLDSSPEMIEAARAEHQVERVRFERGDLREWAPREPVDVLVSNATLQWVPEHLGLLPGLLDQVRPGGWFAFQVPGNFGERSHTAITDLVAEPRWAERLAGIDLARPASEEPGIYLAALQERCDSVDVWETTYFQVLSGSDPVTRWVSGTALRPVLGQLDADEQAEFLAAYGRLVADAYPEQPWGTVLPFRRIFAVGRVR